VSYGVIVPVVLAVAVIVLGLGRLALAAQRVHTDTGSEGLVGRHGVVLTPVGPDHPGQMSIHGEIWRAVSTTPVEPNQRVRVTAIEGLTLHVQPSPADEHPGGVS
jgi:membrane-bound serine protease (ClpP class)